MLVGWVPSGLSRAIMNCSAAQIQVLAAPEHCDAGSSSPKLFFVLRANSKAWLPQHEVVHVATACFFFCGPDPRLGCPRTLLFKHRHSLRWRAVECPCSAHSLHALLRNSIGTRRQQQPPDPIQDLA
mmetsp:Transcript_66088/g.213712  ORF Transcript_66088/g.213712 Transcript_66088/m.213712 type:complete len:127 (-) Transcript_66088:138-518(-)